MEVHILKHITVSRQKQDLLYPMGIDIFMDELAVSCHKQTAVDESILIFSGILVQAIMNMYVHNSAVNTSSDL